MSACTASWSDDRVQTLKRLWGDGLSASQIARSLGGVTRNAVIGKIHRLGLSGRAAPSPPGARRTKPRSEPRLRGVRAARSAIAAVPLPVVEPLPETGLATMVTIRRLQCRWPIGDPLADDFCLCGRPAVRGAYCGPHGALAYWRTQRNHLIKLAGRALA